MQCDYSMKTSVLVIGNKRPTSGPHNGYSSLEVQSSQDRVTGAVSQLIIISIGIQDHKLFAIY